MLTSILLVVSLAQAAAEFPVARAEKEFEAAVPHVAAYCQGVAGNVSLFQRAALPYAPLDLQIRKARGDEANRLRNLWLGVAGAACSVDVAKLTANFHCGERCLFSRRADLRRKLPMLQALVKDVRAARNVRLLALWAPGEWRVNDLYRTPAGAYNEARPSPVMGLVPSADWKRWDRLDAWMKASNVDRRKVEELLGRIEALRIAAVVRDGDAIRVVRIGLGDNESGLLFGSEKAKPPKVGDALPDGRTYVAIEPVAPGVVFYETT
jgi:hypothetical protein